MKRWMKVACALVLLAGFAQGEMIFKGTRELGMSGFLDLDTVEDATIRLDVTFGQFVMDYLQIGTRAGLSISDPQRQFRGDLFTEYNIELNAAVLPYVALSIGILAADVEYEEIEGNDVAFSTGGELGLKGFLTEEVALFGGVEYLWASTKVFLANDKVENTDLRLKLGLRFYF